MSRLGLTQRTCAGAALVLLAALSMLALSACGSGTEVPSVTPRVLPTLQPTRTPEPTVPPAPYVLGQSGRPLAALDPAARNNYFSATPDMVIDPSRQYVATIETALGNVTVALNAQEAPLTTNNFVYLADQGFYDGLTFHRVEHQQGFELVQGGDPAGNGSGGPGYTVPAEIGLPHEAGVIAMARLSDEVNPQRASSGSQFYITLVPISFLDGGYTVFGQVIEGLDVLNAIQPGDVMLSVTVQEM